MDARINILILGILVLMFGSLLRRRTSDQLQFWFIGWVLLLLHYVAMFLDGG